jgi:hypothetical protein
MKGCGKDSREERRYARSIKSSCPHNCFFKATYFAVAIVDKARCYKPEGREFDTRCCDCFNLPNPSGRIRPGGYSASITNEYRKHKNNNVSGQ